MRLLIDSLIALMLIAILAGILLHHRHAAQTRVDHQTVQQALAQLSAETIYHAALGEVELNDRGFPTQVRRKWFGENLPVNVLAPDGQPWLDLAPPGHTADQPPDPIITSPKQAGFWYNPNLGIFRARVPAALSNQQAVEIYNRVNGTKLVTRRVGPQTGKPVEPTGSHSPDPNRHDHRPAPAPGRDEQPAAPTVRPTLRSRSSAG